MASSETFLHRVAADILDRWGAEELRNGCVFFPSGRARLFFVQGLSKLLKRTVWLPSWGEIRSTLEAIAKVRVVDSIELLPYLHSLYCKHLESDESLDDFYFWGEVLLHDFDQVDKYEVDTSALFKNLAELKAIENRIDYLTPEQRAALSQFFRIAELDANHANLTQRYVRLWKKLGVIYQELRAYMQEHGIGYEGFIYREAAAELRVNPTAIHTLGGLPQRLAFVGFNALNQCEHRLFTSAQKEGNTLFYWKATDAQLADAEDESGLFVRENVRRYGQSLPSSREDGKEGIQPSQPGQQAPHEEEKRQIRIVSSPSLLAQAYIAHDLLQEALLLPNGLDSTALILADEALLMPVLRALPAAIAQCNVTMGYPIRNTLAYSLVEGVLTLLKSYKCTAATQEESQGAAIESTSTVPGCFSATAVTALAQHPYACYLAGLTERNRGLELEYCTNVTADGTECLSCYGQFAEKHDFFSALTYTLSLVGEGIDTIVANEGNDDRGESQRLQAALLEREYLLSTSETLAKLEGAFGRIEYTPSAQLILSILPKLFRNAKASFIGQPLSGLQLMGFLETRALSFKRVIILSCNEYHLPQVAQRQSFILPSLQRAFGMPTITEREAMYAYYYQTIVDDADDVTLIYVNNPSEGAKGEASRYIAQLRYSTETAPPPEIPYVFSPYAERLAVDFVPKEGAVLEALQSYLITAEKMGNPSQELTAEINSGQLEPHCASEPPVPFRSLSPHAISDYLSCPLQFYFKHLAKIEEPEKPKGIELTAQETGTILHATLQALLDPYSGSPIPSDLKTQLEANWANELYQQYMLAIHPHTHQVPRAQLTAVEELTLQALEHFMQHYLRVESERLPELAKIEGLEVWISESLELPSGQCVNIRGRADRIDSTLDGRIAIVDYKTGRYDTKNDSFSSLSEVFEPAGKGKPNILQVMLYAYLMQKGNPSGGIYSPALWFLQCPDSDYSPKVYDKGNSEAINDFSPYYHEFESMLSNTLGELFDASIPFTAHRGNPCCDFCAYRQLCGLV
ncbi:MAG: hypothetical protein AL399_02430 [Candidatus [Bacteroides] periocalifornicus]|uniref:PD-(D/E)XK endonuclease-like domain-containing protein n=1 Tax=Candidatus [Bacteroides] periocalifornicus TaxID=1702214 RepID=A0A0Q4B8V0_9BACT|nr:MAG: hypothetical protein AL399_02235 [Candidatus [Bacteroides] periocalifornicus]KQM09341.1 MAG: hypothetical protein AL399_02430 [Candidatus [Bacteroides] periocalifornicus]